MYYFIGILNEVGDIFLLDYLQVFSLLNLRFKDISKSYKSSVQRGESFIYTIFYTIYKMILCLMKSISFVALKKKKMNCFKKKKKNFCVVQKYPH